jgi:hypothetical protein
MVWLSLAALSSAALVVLGQQGAVSFLVALFPVFLFLYPAL